MKCYQNFHLIAKLFIKKHNQIISKYNHDNNYIKKSAYYDFVISTTYFYFRQYAPKANKRHLIVYLFIYLFRFCAVHL